ncbi:amino acid--[acyl-carrier-protein] ligase [Roseomonas sp. 18066]|uniref:amino acid--[acyl-carrier-protein] ligase n=1 Tax=Roseomonas sp. 18066 TaxID=2681412 RepID=UPI00135B8C16|nr:amino acid--[acyl-carrier-protein] ligase [Roseomonas sp. 18066]
MSDVISPRMPAEAGRPEVFRDALLAAGVLLDGGGEGLALRSGAFEEAARGIEALMARQMADDGAEIMMPPPAMPLRTLTRTGYMRSFPQLAGTVSCFCGDEPGHRRLVASMEAGETWTGQQEPSEVSLIPAACYLTYGQVAQRGPVAMDGKRVAVEAWCFRHEPSPDPCRMLMFRMRECVYYGTPDGAKAHRDQWLARMGEMAAMLQLPYTIEPANDPFFGRIGKIMARSQLELELKMELLIHVSDTVKPTACASVNLHLDSMGAKWGLETADGAVAHTACGAYGIDRLTLALFRHHGPDLAAWPAGVRAALWP